MAQVAATGGSIPAVGEAPPAGMAPPEAASPPESPQAGGMQPQQQLRRSQSTPASPAAAKQEAKPSGKREKIVSVVEKYDTPSPQDYAIVLSDGKNHKFGRVDQVSAPKFTMRGKTKFGEPKSTGTEPSGPLAHQYDTIMTKMPKWTMAPRNSGIPRPADQPGPGEYHIPSTIYGSHPQLTCAGRVPKQTGKRPELALSKDGPGPSDYATLCSDGKKHKFGRIDQVSAPGWTMRAKTKFGEVKPTGTEPSGPLADKQDAVMHSPPKWTMTGRSSGIPKPADQPGPGEYPVPSTLYGSHPQLTCAGRVPKQTEERKQPAPKDITPSPQDYEIVLSHGKKHKFGRIDQVSAPGWTMRAKTKFGEAKPTGTEPSGPLADKVDAVMNRPPCWSMPGRSSGIPSPADQPGPGEYPIPSTLYGVHPQLTCAGRVPKRTQKRPELAWQTDTPAPGDYATVLSDGENHKFGRYDQTTGPSWTMRAKTKFGEAKPTGTEPSGPLADKVDGIMNRPPTWSMPGRGAGIPKPADQPGPGEYPIPGSIYGDHPTLVQPGRVPKTTEKRPEPGHGVRPG
eukprot:TRINITY_DN42734_c0_g1_i1.p1 TRINITY_DN42734_c0_g1~~TRINITY_DN42734_c0_g1_i1.p1  ORF type:complete len:585 (-),score=58.22 TRINITY_DN42734_c0_g1_i1:27-1724(-)